MYVDEQKVLNTRSGYLKIIEPDSPILAAAYDVTIQHGTKKVDATLSHNPGKNTTDLQCYARALPSNECLYFRILMASLPDDCTSSDTG
jgi:hypothetical protein